MSIDILAADYRDPRHAQDLSYLLNCYALDPMGGGEALPEQVRLRLAGELAALPHAFSVLCYIDDEPAGLVNCFEGFSTFQCRRLVNIHDVVVLEQFRGRGISSLMLAEVEAIARRRDCCKLTLEVLEGNLAAQRAYRRFGFEAYQLDPTEGSAMFWQKSLD
jgi:ribosomal protein S18 acetylase RimI-like enzyme